MMPFSWACCRRGAELLAQTDDLFPGHAVAAGHDVVEGFALDVLHGVVGGAVGLADGEEPDDVGMLKLLEDLGLAVKARGGGVAGSAQAGGHDLDGDHLAGLDVRAAIDGAHGAGAEFFLDEERS